MKKADAALRMSHWPAQLPHAPRPAACAARRTPRCSLLAGCRRRHRPGGPACAACPPTRYARVLPAERFAAEWKGCHGDLDFLHPRGIGPVLPPRLAVTARPLERFHQSQVRAFVPAVLVKNPQV